MNAPRATFCADCGSPKPGRTRWSPPSEQRSYAGHPPAAGRPYAARPPLAEPPAHRLARDVPAAAVPEPPYDRPPDDDLPYDALSYDEQAFEQPAVEPPPYGDPAYDDDRDEEVYAEGAHQESYEDQLGEEPHLYGAPARDPEPAYEPPHRRAPAGAPDSVFIAPRNRTPFHGPEPAYELPAAYQAPYPDEAPTFEHAAAPYAALPHGDVPRAGDPWSRYRPLDHRWPDDPWPEEPVTTRFGPDPVPDEADDPVLAAPRTPRALPSTPHVPYVPPRRRIPLGGRIAFTIAILGMLAASGVAVANMAGWSWPRVSTANPPTGPVPATRVGPTGAGQLPVSPSAGPSSPSSPPLPSPSPSHSTSLSPTPSATPSRPTSPAASPTPTPPPTAIGSVDVRTVNTNPHVRAVGGLFDTYFNGINLKRYDQVLALYDPNGVLDPTDPQQAANFTSGVSTSVDSDIVVRSIADATSASLVTRITFQSHQAAGYGPPGAPDQTCTLWDSTYVLHPNSNGVYLIFDQPVFSHQGC